MFKADALYLFDNRWQDYDQKIRRRGMILIERATLTEEWCVEILI